MDKQEFYSVNEVIDFTRRITYKPGYDLDFKPALPVTNSASRYGFITPLLFSISYTPVDSVEPNRHLRITFTETFSLSLPVRQDMLLHLIRTAIHRMEQHEADEFFKIDGIPPFYPHRGDDPYAELRRRQEERAGSPELSPPASIRLR